MSVFAQNARLFVPPNTAPPNTEFRNWRDGNTEILGEICSSQTAELIIRYLNSSRKIVVKIVDYLAILYIISLK